MLTIQTLVTTMFQKDDSKFFEMNIQTDAVIANQSDSYAYSEQIHNGYNVKLITTATRGLSRNRNIALTYAQADIIVFADDDQYFIDGYDKIIIKEFEDHPDAEVIKFFCNSNNESRPLAYKQPDCFKKATRRALMSGGVIGVAVRREILEKTDTFFHVNIGAGTDIFCGEDSVFFNELYEQKIKIYLSPAYIGYVKQDDSTWFNGYTEKYFLSAGYIYSCIYRKLAILAVIRRSWKLRKEGCEQGFFKRISLMRKGIRKHRKEK